MESIIYTAFILDDSYVVQTSVALTSLKVNKNIGTHYVNYLLCSNVSPENKKYINKLATKDFELKFIDVENDKFKAVDDSDQKYLAATNTALFKFELPNILSHIDKVIYLDGDVIFKKDLTDLYSINLDDNTYVAACPDLPQVLYEKPIFDTGNGKKYFNSGVMLLNLKKMRSDKTSELLFETKLIQKDDKLMDQNVLNIVFDKKVLTIPPVFNLTYLNLKRSVAKYRLEDLNNLFNTKYTSLDDILNQAYVVHFSSKDKPWTFYDVPCADEWIYYFSISPFSHLRLNRFSVTERNKTNFKKLDIATESQNDIPVVLCTNQNYVPNLCVTIRSIIENHKKDRDISIYVLHTELSDETINTVRNMEIHGVSINFLNIKTLNELNNKNLYTVAHYSSDMYNRWYIPELLYKYNKIIYLDCDLVVCADIQDLYNKPLNKNLFGACINLQYTSKSNYRKRRFDLNANEYFNTGVLIINSRVFIQENYKKKLFDYVCSSSKLDCPDQDALNVVCKNRIKTIENKWNVQWHHEFTKQSGKADFDTAQYKKDINNPYILHYTSGNKPWNYDISNNGSQLFWEFAKNTPFLYGLLEKAYESMLSTNGDTYPCKASQCSMKYGLIVSYLLKTNRTKECKEFISQHTEKINRATIKGWCSNVIKNDELFGWLLNEENFATRKAIIKINNSTFEVECNFKRSKPGKFTEHKNNGFRLRLSSDFISKLPKKTSVIVIDEETNLEVYRSTISCN